MIKIENGTVEFEGTLINLLAEFTELAREFKGLLRKKLGDERSEQEFNKILRIANMSNAELEAEAKESLQHILDELFKKPRARREDGVDADSVGR